MSGKNKRYSIYIKPISIIANLVIINFFLWFFLEKAYSGFWHITFTNLSWLIISYHLDFYNIRRYHKNADLLSRLFLQFLIFTFVYFAYYSLTNKSIHAMDHIKILLYIFLAITTFRSMYLYALKKYRMLGGNFRNIMLIGSNKSMQNVGDFIENHPELGYKILGNFSNNSKTFNYLGTIDASFTYAQNNIVDEVICSISELTQDQIKKFIDFTDNNLIVLKLIPDAKDIFTKKMKVEYFDYIPILSLRKIPIDDPVNQFFKRAFDIVFSLIILIFVLSWLSIILYILIKLDSKGPLFFVQTRDGLSYNTFKCIKYRSMKMNALSDDIQATKEDTRITRIGEFIRKTSIDELPQFINVLLGDMSIVGPRPHMPSQTIKYAKVVDKFMVRHFIKPGITGLAQTRGYRGEIEKNEDMENRVRLDIFYIENWSLLFDFHILLMTPFSLLNTENAY